MKAVSTLVVVLLSAVGLFACGGGDTEAGDTGNESQLASPPEAASSLEEQMQALNEAIASDDCEAFGSLTFTFLRARDEEGQLLEPGSPGTEEECKATEQVRRMLDGVELTEVAEYGTAGLTEGQLPKPVGGYDTMVVSWMLDSDGEYRHTFLGPGDPGIGTEPLEGTDFEEVMDSMLEAVRSGDCSGADEIFNEAGAFAEPGSTPEEQCEGLAGGQIFAPALKATEDAYFTVTLGTPIAKQQGSLSEEEQGTFTVADLLPNTEVEIPPPTGEKKQKG